MNDIAGFDPTQYEPSDGPVYEAIPAGTYIAIVTEATMVDSKKKPGVKMLKCVYTVVDGPFRGKKVFDYYCLVHINQQTMQIARQQLAKLCQCFGINRKLQSASELCNKPFKLTVKVKGDQNEVVGRDAYQQQSYQPPQAAAPQQQFAPPLPQAPAPAAAPQQPSDLSVGGFAQHVEQQEQQWSPQQAAQTQGGGAPWKR